MHSHKCPECGTVWQHGSSCIGNTLAHTCPKGGCRGQSWSHYSGDTEPEFVAQSTCLTEEQSAKGACLDIKSFFNV
jgi:predicted  nucleic acid-binding Zn-ribbon protein